jgi:hypothetical protein
MPSCPNSVWVEGTLIKVGESNGCGALRPGSVQGVLCCKVE